MTRDYQPNQNVLKKEEYICLWCIYIYIYFVCGVYIYTFHLLASDIFSRRQHVLSVMFLGLLSPKFLRFNKDWIFTAILMLSSHLYLGLMSKFLVFMILELQWNTQESH